MDININVDDLISSLCFYFMSFAAFSKSVIFPINKFTITFFFSFITQSILLYPYLVKSIIYFFFSSSYPNKELNCFLNTSNEFNDPEEGRLIDLILSYPLLMNIGFVWSN